MIVLYSNVNLNVFQSLCISSFENKTTGLCQLMFLVFCYLFEARIVLGTCRNPPI